MLVDLHEARWTQNNEKIEAVLENISSYVSVYDTEPDTEDSHDRAFNRLVLTHEYIMSPGFHPQRA
jgi:hypothetical protein